MLIFYIFDVLILVIGLEIFLSLTWNSWYFRQGIPIYRKIYPIPAAMELTAKVATDKWIPDGWKFDLIFHDVSENEIAFREEFKLIVIGFRYSAIMRGFIKRNAANSSVEVVGKLNWFVVIFALYFFSSFAIPMWTDAESAITSALFGVLFLTVLSVILFVIYRIQATRFNRIGDIFESNIDTNQKSSERKSYFDNYGKDSSWF
jgi:hypothetical protein